MSLTDEQKQEIADELRGSCGGEVLFQLCEKFGIDDLDIRLAAEEKEVVQCDGCNWYFDAADVDLESQTCGECRE